MMHKDNLRVESECTWGVPSMTKPSLVQATPTTVTKGTYHDYNNPCVRKDKVISFVVYSTIVNCPWPILDILHYNYGEKILIFLCSCC